MNTSFTTSWNGLFATLFLRKLFVAVSRLLILLPMLLVGHVSAQAGAPDAKPAISEFETAMKAAQAVATFGPAEVALGGQAKLKLPADYVFIPGQQAKSILRAMGNSGGGDVMGIIFPPQTSQAGWMVVATYAPSGYVKDDDAKDWKADELLKNIKEGTEAANAERKSRGFPEMLVEGWIEKPNYDATKHRLVWSILSSDKGAPATAEKGVNYNTYALGREGYISLNLVTDASTIESEKVVAQRLLSELNFIEGKKYSDFNASTDKVAEYGLAALVAGAAAKKLGLLAVIGAFFLKFAKIFIFGGAALLAGAVKLFGRKKED